MLFFKNLKKGMKPSGVVDDQSWSNSRFKLALKVADRSDSMEMLKTPDAAEITQVGRGYLQVGNNEVYELFQSAWSGADYQPDKDEQGIEDHTIYAINDIGQYEILNEDLSGLEQAESIKEVPSELQAIVSKLKALTERLSIQALPQPWLPPLSKEIFLQDLRPQGFKDLWGQASGLVARLGMVDIPSRQSQEVLEHDFEKDGHIALFSSPGMGKSTFVQTVLVDLFRQNNPDRLHTYLLDFGTNGLLALNDYPHVAEYFLVEETEKLQKLIKRLQDEIRERRKLFTDSSVHNIEMYRKLGDRKLADIVIAVDSYDGLKGSEVEVAIDTLLQTLARDGMGLGIYLILTASRTGALKNNLYSNFKRRIALKMNDDSEARAIVGRTALVIEDVPGRGLIQVDDPELIQLAMPAKGENGLEMIEALRHESQEMAKNWNGALPQGIVIVPEVLDEQTFLQMVETEKAIASDFIPIGLEFEEVHTISLPIPKLKHLLILTEKEQHKLVAVRHLLNMLWHVRKGQSVTLFDVTDEYGRFAGKVKQYYSSSELTENVVEELKMRVLHARKQKEQLNEFVIISDLPAFMTVDGMSDNDFALLYEEGQRVGLHLIVVANKTYMSLSSGIQRLIKQKLDTVLIAMKMSNQSVVARSEVGREAELAIDEVYLHYQDQQIKLKITKEIE